MGDTKLALFGAFETQLRHLSQRQKTVAENIANADTPGYQARDVAASPFAKMLNQRSSGSQTVSMPHIDMPEAFAKLGSRTVAHNSSVVDKNVQETKPSGNTVSLEEQLAKQADVQMDYAMITNLYRKQMGLIRTALGKGRN
jgi:flagellar basal-body rod protein FlgB